jgi:hypothetical protein
VAQLVVHWTSSDKRQVSKNSKKCVAYQFKAEFSAYSVLTVDQALL